MSDISVTPQSNRFASLDLLRGIAIIAILLINIQSFGFVLESYLNPFVGGDFTGLNVVSWFFTHIFIDQKFYTIFSMLFGAGIVLLATRAEAKGVSAAKLHYRRSIFLLIIGVCHATFVWYGDILSAYAMCALFAYFMWRRQAKTQIIAGLLLVSVVVPVNLYFASSITGETAVAIQQGFNPSDEALDEVINAYQGSYSENIIQRGKMQENEAQTYEMVAMLRIFGCIIIGMGLLKSGFINAQWSQAEYRKKAKLFLSLGFPLVIASAVSTYLSGYEDAVFTRYGLGNLNYIGSFLLALGYISLVNLWFFSERQQNLKSRLQAIGQMAFTNYLVQSIVCTYIFYGFGFGLFGELSRFEMLLIAFVIVAIQFWYSKLWLSKFKMGPLEWILRMLTYWQLPSLIKKKETVEDKSTESQQLN